MKLLHLDSGLFKEQSVSRQLTAQIVRQLHQLEPELQTVYRDLAEQAPAHLSAEVLMANRTAPEQRTAEQHEEAELTSRLLEEFLGADVVVIGAPMYNFSIPSQLKAWLDRILQAGVTFRYTAEGPEGLAGGKKVIIASSRGGIYSKGAAAAMDFQEAYLKTAFSFIGIDDVSIIRAEGVNLGDDAKQLALHQAAEDVISLLQSAKAA